VNLIPEHNRILRGLFAWTGAKSIGVPYERRAREAGESKAFTIYSINFALKAIFGFSYLPITMLTALGFALASFSFLALLVFCIKFIFWGVPFDGFGTITGLMLLLFGFVFVVLGVIGRYVSLIYEDTKGRPNHISIDEAGFKAPRRGGARG
jgi:dolichol-phosphate mannosyltransferase